MRREVEGRVWELAARQQGLVTRKQLLDAGMGAEAVRSRVAGGRLCPVHRGVYRVGPLVGPLAREMAAVLACGPGAVVSHGSAGALRGLLRAGGGAAPVDVRVPPERNRRRPGIRVRRGATLSPDEVGEIQGVPVTSLARTVFDLAAELEARSLEACLARAERQGLERSELAAMVERRPRRRGMPALRALLLEEAAPAFTRSEAEARFLALVRKARLPRPTVNGRLGGMEVDFLWRSDRLAVEVDGFAFHSSRGSFEADRRRDARLSALGYRVVRVTWRRIVEEPEATLVLLAQALAAARTTPTCAPSDGERP